MFSLNRKSNDGALPATKFLPFRSRRSVVALDFEGDMVRVAQASGQGRSARVTRVASAKLQISPEKQGDAVALGSALKAAMASLKINPKDAALSLPRAQVVLRPLQVPMAVDVRELASIINFQISKDLPFRLEDAVIDFKVLRLIEGGVNESSENKEPSPGKLEVLVGAVRSDLVDFYRQVAKTAGFKLGALGLRSVAAAFCASKCASTGRGKRAPARQRSDR